MLTAEQRQHLQNAIRLLQLDGDRDVWTKVAEGLGQNSGLRVPFDLSDTVRTLSSRSYNVARAEEQARNYQEVAKSETRELEETRAKLLVQLTEFLETEG